MGRVGTIWSPPGHSTEQALGAPETPGTLGLAESRIGVGLGWGEASRT